MQANNCLQEMYMKLIPNTTLKLNHENNWVKYCKHSFASTSS